MGVHSAEVELLFTPAEEWEASGEGVTGALQVLQLGDAGHILVSDGVAQSVQND